MLSILQTSLVLYFILQIVGAIFLVFGIAVFLFRRNSGKWLSHEVSRHLRSLSRGTVMEDLPETGGAWRGIQDHLASGASLLTMPIIVVLLHVVLASLFLVAVMLEVPLLSVRIPANWNNSAWSSFLSDLWQVQATIIGITFVVIVLLVEAFGGRLRREDLFRFYIRKSYILPIAFAGLTLTGTIGIVRLLINQVDLMPWWMGALVQLLALSLPIMFVLFLLATAWLYLRTLDFLKPSWIQQARIQLAEQAIQEAIRWEARQRIGHELFQRRCLEMGLEHLPWDTARRDLTPIRADQDGWVIDVNLLKLREFARMLAHEVPSADDADRKCRGFILKNIDSHIRTDSDVLA